MKCACGIWNVGVGVGGEKGWVGLVGGCAYGAWRMRISVWRMCPTGGGRGRRIPPGLRIAVRWALGARHGGGVICDSAVVLVWEGGREGVRDAMRCDGSGSERSGKQGMEDGKRKTEDGEQVGRPTSLYVRPGVGISSRAGWA